MSKSKKPKSKKPQPTFPFNQFLVVVGYVRSKPKYADREKYPMGDPDSRVLFGRVLADMGMAPPEPELTDEEMQPVAYAAKMALLRVMDQRLQRNRGLKR